MGELPAMRLRCSKEGRGLYWNIGDLGTPEPDDALEVGQRLVRVNYLRHRRGFGRRAARPRIFASR
jgi:hypothetical protein